MYLCDKCGAKLVQAGKIRPLGEIFGVNNIPFKFGKCEKCGKEENLMLYPDFELNKKE